MKLLRNSWHLSKFPNNLLKASYIEWKYFNFSAPGVSGIFVYLIADPLNFTGIGGGRVVGRIFIKKKIWGGAVDVQMKNVAPSNKSAAIQMGGDNFVRVSGNGYYIGGKVKNIAWKLKYSPLLRPIRGFSNMSLDFLGIERGSWEIKMPKANVSGTIKIGGRTVPIHSLGYSDANWGNAVPISIKFNWAQYNDDKISLAFFETQGLGMGKRKTGHWSEIFINCDGKAIRFLEKNIHAVNTSRALIPGTKMKVPTVMLIRAENKDYNLILRVCALHADPLELKTPFSLPVRPVTVEQPSLMSGGLFRKTRGSPGLLHKISGQGFMEHTLYKVEFGNARSRRGVLI